MDIEEYRRHGKEMVDIVADYLLSVGECSPIAQVKPGYLQKMVPGIAPDKPDSWEDVMNDLETIIMPGLTHWQSPRFFAYYPAACSYPSLCAEVLSAGLNSVGVSWIASPASTELEVVVMDWLVKLLGLPDFYLSGGAGGGVLQGSASECVLLALFAARACAITKGKERNPGLTDYEILERLVAYTSDEANTCVLKACLFGAVRCRVLVSDEDCALRGQSLASAIEKDRKQGYIPFFVTATLGTTSTCAFDKLSEIGPICETEDIWLHIDAAYAGSAFVCPEFRSLMDGVKYTQSFCFNPHKWLMVNYQCSCLWLRESCHLTEHYNVEAAIMPNNENGKLPDYKQWQIGIGRKFSSLKLWFVLRLIGASGLKQHIRHDVSLAKTFAGYVEKDSRFEVVNQVQLGLVCFRLKIAPFNERTNELLKRITKDGRIFVVSSVSKGVFYIRFAVGTPNTKEADVIYAWQVIQEITNNYLEDQSITYL